MSNNFSSWFSKQSQQLDFFNQTILCEIEKQLTGEIPLSIGNLLNLTKLYLQNNQLTGEIPPSIGILVNLEFLDLQNNQLTGEIPSTIGNLVNLKNLTLQNNQLTGEIPLSIGELQNVQYLYLQNNQLTGEIPLSIEKLQNLKYLSLENNQLSGKIPSTIGTLPNLKYLSLRENYFTEPVPKSLLKIARSSQKKFKFQLKIDNSFKQFKQTCQNQFTQDLKTEIQMLKQENLQLKNEKQTIQKQLTQTIDNLKTEIQQMEQQMEQLTENKGKQSESLRSILWLHAQLQLQQKLVTLEDFEIIDVKGKGAHGMVMICLVCHRKVALKMILNTEENTDSIVARSEREFHILRSLTSLHPNIIHMLFSLRGKPTQQMIDQLGRFPLQYHLGDNIQEKRNYDDFKYPDGTIRGTQFFVLEYHPQTLKAFVEDYFAKKSKNQLNESDEKSYMNKVKKYGLDLAEGLKFLHSNKIAHLDVKLDNLMISEFDNLVIIDFGCAVKLDENWCCKKENGKKSHEDLNCFNMQGNRAHQSPELLLKRLNCEGKYSICCYKQHSWELGTIMFELFTGKLPIDGYEVSPPDSIEYGSIGWSEIPGEFQNFLKCLLCDEGSRMPISIALDELKQLVNGSVD